MAGVLAETEDSKTERTATEDDDDEESNVLIRQSEDSNEQLLDPPIAVSDPYGWLRDEKRTNPEVLQHLHAENKYTEQLTSHLQNLRTTLVRTDALIHLSL